MAAEDLFAIYRLPALQNWAPPKLPKKMQNMLTQLNAYLTNCALKMTK